MQICMCLIAHAEQTEGLITFNYNEIGALEGLVIQSHDLLRQNHIT